MTVTTIDPSTGQPLDAYQETTSEQLDSLLDEARSAYRGWRELTPDQRADGWAGWRATARAQRRAGPAGDPGDGQTAGGEPRRG